MVVFGMVVIEQKCLYSDKSDCNRANWLYPGKFVVFGNGCCIWAKVVGIGQIRLYSGK